MKYYIVKNTISIPHAIKFVNHHNLHDLSFFLSINSKLSRR